MMTVKTTAAIIAAKIMTVRMKEKNVKENNEKALVKVRVTKDQTDQPLSNHQMNLIVRVCKGTLEYDFGQIKKMQILIRLRSKSKK